MLVQGEERRVFHCVRDGATVHLFWEGVAYRIEERNEEGARVAHRRDRGAGLEATMPGKVIAVKASPGQAVKKGDEVVVVEAMKMENALRAPRDGTIKTVAVEVGDMVGPGSVTRYLLDQYGTLIFWSFVILMILAGLLALRPKPANKVFN